jgi:hypothetical protein
MRPRLARAALAAASDHIVTRIDPHRVGRAVQEQAADDLAAVRRYLGLVSTDVAPAVQHQQSRRVRVVVVTAVVVLVVLAGVGLRWWTHPNVFGNLGDSFAAVPLPVADAALSTTVIFPNVEGEDETVRVDHIKAIFVKNTAEATATFFICHLSAGESPIGAVHDPETYCRDIVAVEEGASFHHGVFPSGDYLFVTITPTRPGIARLARVEVGYERGARHFYQRGTESIQVDRKVIAT